MPDNQLQDWTADEQFWDDAWKDMERQLDREMPAGKRRAAPLWSWLVGSLLLLAIPLFLYYSGTSGQEDKLPLERTNSESVLPASPQAKAQEAGDEDQLAAVTLTENANIESNEAPEDQSVVSAQRSPNEAVRFAQRPNEGAGRNRPSSLATTSPPLVVIAPTDDPDNSTTPSGAPIPSGSLNDQDYETGREATGDKLDELEATAVPPVSRHAYRLAVHQPVLELTVNAPATTTAEESGFTKSPQRKVVLVAGLLHGSTNPGIGGYGGLALEQKLGEKSRLTAGLEYYTRREAFTLQTIDESSVGDVSILGPDTNETFVAEQVVAYQQRYNNLRSNGSNYFQTSNLRLSLSYGRSLGKRWLVDAGLGVSYLLEARAPLLVADPGRSLQQEDGGAFVNLTEDRFSSFSSNGGSIPTNPGDALGLRRLRYDLALTVGYRLGHRWEVNGGLRTFVSPLLDGNFKTDRYLLQVGLRYRLGQ